MSFLPRGRPPRLESRSKNSPARDRDPRNFRRKPPRLRRRRRFMTAASVVFGRARVVSQGEHVRLALALSGDFARLNGVPGSGPRAMRYSIFSHAAHTFRGYLRWTPLWREPEPK